MRRLDDSPPTELEIGVAKEQMLKEAYVYAREHQCSLIIALGMIQAANNAKAQQLRSLADGR